MSTFKLKNVLFCPRLSPIGGVETFAYELCLKYGKEYDITVMYQVGDPEMIKHISEVARVLHYRIGDKIECDVFLFGHLIENSILDCVKADKYIQTLHADYIDQNLVPCLDPRVTCLYGVSENTTRGIKKRYGEDVKVKTVYNPYTVKPARRVLKLISATRFKSEEQYDRMNKLAKALDESGYPYRWDVYTDKPKTFNSVNVIVHEARLDILDFIADADYLVQLSDTEGYSYSILEALSVGTAVITTPMPTTEEQGVIDGKTGFVLPFDMSRIPVDDIYEFAETGTWVIPSLPPRQDEYGEILSPGKAEYAPDPNDIVVVRCIRFYSDIELGRFINKGEIYEVKRSRGEHLENCGFAVIEG